MPKYPFIFLVLLLTTSHAYALELELNQKSFIPNDKLVIFGTAIPNDSLIIELFNPTGNLIYRSQLDVDANGEFASILLEWPEPDNDIFRVGTYTLLITSSINPELSISKAFIYQVQQQVRNTDIKIEKKITLELSIPSNGVVHDEIPILAYVTLNNVPLIGLELIEGRIKYPDASEVILDNFISIGDGLYQAQFTSNMTGYHTIVLNIKHQELFASKASIININEEPISNEATILDELSVKVDSLNKTMINNTNSISNDVSSIKGSIDKMTSAIGQLTSLLLPIIGMIAIIVALQATILAKRK